MLSFQALNNTPKVETNCAQAAYNKNKSKNGTGKGDFSEVFFGKQPDGKSSSPFKSLRAELKQQLEQAGISLEEDLEAPDDAAAANVMFYVPQIINEAPPEEAEAEVIEEIPATAPVLNTGEEIVLPETEQDTQENVVSILEGNNIDPEVNNNTDTDAVPQNAYATPEEREFAETISEKLSGTEETARMPQPGVEVSQQTNANLNLKKTETVTEADPVVLEAIGDKADTTCPLENENDPADDGENTQASQADTKIDTSGKEKSKVSSDDESSYSKTAANAENNAAAQMLDIQPEKLVADVKMDAAVKMEATATPESLFDTMVEQIEMSRSEGVNIISIQIKPEFLGKVNIQLSLTENGLSAKIQSDDINVKNALSAQASQLVESLSDKGIRVTEVEVEYTGVSDHNFDGSQGENQAQYQQGSDPYYSSQDKANDDKFMASLMNEAESVNGETQVIDDEISSVEYRA